MAAFPDEAVYGGLDQASLRQWDGRDDTSSEPQTPTEDDIDIQSSGSNVGDAYEDVLHIASRDIEGNDCPEIEVTRLMTTCGHTKSLGCPSSLSDVMLLHRHHSGEDELSARSIGTNSMVLPLSPSANSVGTDLTDLEHKMTQEVNTVKDWLSKVKSERDRYKHERNGLRQQLYEADLRRSEELSMVRKELDLVRVQAEEQVTTILEELQSSKVQLEEITKVASPRKGSNIIQDLQKQLECVKAKLILAEKELDNEKTSSSLRQVTKLEEAHHKLFEEHKAHITEMEQKFKVNLAEIRAQKDEEVQGLEEELATAKEVQEHLACQIDDVNDELTKVKNEFATLSTKHEQCPTVLMMEEAVKKVKDEMKAQYTTVEAEKKSLMAQLAAKDVELIQVKREYTNDHDRMKEQLSNLTKLVETKSSDLEKSHELTASLHQKLSASKLETAMATEQITQLSEENFKLKQKVDKLNQREQERNVEVLQLNKKLEEINSLVSSQSQDSGSKDEEVSGERVTATKAVGCTVPKLDYDSETVLFAVETVYDVNFFEATRKKLEMVESERDSIKAELESMKKVSPPTKSTESDLTTVADLEKQLEKAEKLYIDVAVENSELKAKLRSKESNSNESIALELKSIKAALLIKNAEIATLKRRAFLNENSQAESEKSADDRDEQAMKLKNEVIGMIADLLDENQKLPVFAGLDAETLADVPAGIILGNDIDGIKYEHRVEVKLLMEKHAFLKTQVKLLTKQKDQISHAYEVEQMCSAELENSLQEMVALLEAERSMYMGKMAELKQVKHKFSKLKKKRVPVDAAHRASLMLLEQLEHKKIASKCNEEIDKVMGAAVALINSLTEAIEKEDCSDLSLVSSNSSKDFSLPDNTHTKALSEACEKLELVVYSFKMQLSSKTMEYDVLLKAKADDDEKARKENSSLQKQLDALKEKNRSHLDEKQLASAISLEVVRQEKDNLMQQLRDAETKCLAFGEEKTKLFSEIEEAKESVATTRQENECLKQQLQETKTRVGELLCVVEELRVAQYVSEETAKEYEKNLDEMRTTVELLQNEKRENNGWARKCATLEADKNKLIDEIAKSRESLAETVAQFEQTLTATCEAHEKKLGKEKEECGELKEQLDRVEKELSESKEASQQETARLSEERRHIDSRDQLDESLHELKEGQRDLGPACNEIRLENENLKQQIHDAEIKCQTLEADKIKLHVDITRAKESFEQVIAEFEQTLAATCEAHENARKENSSLQKQLDALKEKNRSHLDEKQLASTILIEVVRQEKDNLMQQLRDAETKCLAFGEEKTKLFSEIEEAKESVATTRQENECLKQQLQDAEADKDKLLDEISRAKEGFEEIAAEFEGTLTATCEAHEKALRMKQDECGRLKEQLDRVVKELSDSKEASLQEIARLTEEKQTNEESQRDFVPVIKDDVNHQENESLKQQIQDAKKRCQTLEAEKLKLMEEVMRAKDSFEQVIAEFEQELKATCAASETSLEKKRVECKGLHEQLARLKAELSDSKETSLQEITRLTEMTSADKASIEELQMELEKSKKEIAQLSDTLPTDYKSLDELREELADSEESERALQEVIAIHVSSIETLKKDLREANNKVEELVKFIDQIEESSSKSQSKINDVKEELEATKISLKESMEMCIQLKSEIAEKDALARSLSKAKSGLESQAANHDKAISMIEHELETIKSEITLKNKQVQVAKEEKEKTKHELDMAIKSMEEVVGSLQKQIKTLESEKELNRDMYEKDIQLQQREVEVLQKKHAAAMSDLDSLSELMSDLKAALQKEKDNGKTLLDQFNKSEEDREAQVEQKAELEKELAARMTAYDALSEQIRCLESEVAVAITEEEELELKEKISSQEKELKQLRSKLYLEDDFKITLHKKEEEATKLRINLQEAKEKLSKLHSENEMLRKENTEAVNSMSIMLNDAVRGRAEADLSLQESIHLLEKQKRVDIKKNSQISKMEHELEILKTKERYQESLIASLKNQIRRGG